MALIMMNVPDEDMMDAKHLYPILEKGTVLSSDVAIVEWISVEERLPISNQIYLVTLNNYATDFCAYFSDIKKFGMIHNGRREICDEVTA